MYAQVPAALPRTPDSLAALLRQPALPDTVRINALAKLSDLRRYTDLKEGRRLAEQGLALARRTNYLAGELRCLLSLFNIVASGREYVKAEQLAQQALKISENAPPRLLYLRVMALQDLAGVSNSTNNDFQRAGQYYRQALATAYQMRPAKPRVLNQVLVGLASFYVNRLQAGETADSIPQLGKRYARLGLRGARELQDEESIGDCLVALGIIARSTQQLDSAAYFLRDALQVFQRTANLNSASFAWLALAHVFNNQEKFVEAEAASRQAMQLAKQVQDSRSQLDACNELGIAYAGQGKYRQAYETTRRISALNDSLSKMSNAESLNDLQVRFDTQRKENDIRALTQEQEQERQRRTALATGPGRGPAGPDRGGGPGPAPAPLPRPAGRPARRAHPKPAPPRTASTPWWPTTCARRWWPSPASPICSTATCCLQDTERLASLGGLIRQAAQNLSELLDNLLNWAISQRGELVPAPRPLRTNELLAEIAALYQTSAEAVEVALTAAAGPDLVVAADPDMTRTILRNLTSNALKATPAGGTVQLQAVASPAGIMLQVADTGRGLPPAVQAQMQQPDPHLHVAVDGSGAGLGLLLSRRFAQAQGGTLALAAAPAGPGTVATLTLPAS